MLITGRVEVVDCSPDPCGIAREPAFGEGDEFGSMFRSFPNESDCFLDGSSQIKVNRLYLSDGNSNWRGHAAGCVGGYC